MNYNEMIPGKYWWWLMVGILGKIKSNVFVQAKKKKVNNEIIPCRVYADKLPVKN